MTEQEQALLPTEAEVKFYRENGYWVSRRIYTDAEMDAAVEAQDRLYRNDQDTDYKLPWPWKPEHGNVIRKTDYSGFAMNALMALIRKPILGAIAAKLSGSPEIRLWHDQLLFKPGTDKPATGNVNVGWHTDRGYWVTCTSDDMLTGWVAFQDTPPEMGSVMMVRGSHRWPESQGLDFFDGDMAKLEKNFNTGGNPVEKVALTIPRGCVSFHHCRTIHGSGPNQTPRPRRSIAIHLQPGDNRYREFHHADRKLGTHANDQFARKVDGKPDYSDPALCPRLYPS